MSTRPARKLRGSGGCTVAPASMKARLKRDAARYPESTRVRLHRALSWLERAGREANDPDAMFVFLWIAFNAAYAREFGHDENERARFAQFIGALLEVDEAQRLQLSTTAELPARALSARAFEVVSAFVIASPMSY